MIYNKSLSRNLGLIFFVIVGCNQRMDDYSYISLNEYPNYMFLADENFGKPSDCHDIVKKNLYFKFLFDKNLKLDTSNCTFLIIRNGVLYRGPFNEKINVKDVHFCLDNKLLNINPWAFVLLDHKTKITYKFYRKDSYYFYEDQEITIKLFKSGYKAKFYNDWFFR